MNKHAPVKFVPTKSSRLCSEHFSADTFEKGSRQKVVLKPDAVPTIIKQGFAEVICVI